MSNFKKKLDQSAEAKCVFISDNSASELSELTKKAKNYQDWEEFTQTAFNTKEWRKHFSTLCSKWNHYPSKEIEEAIEAIGKARLSNNQKHIVQLANNAYECLKRIDVKTIDENQLKEKLKNRIRSLVEKKTDEISFGDKWWSNVIDILAQFALDKVQHKLKALDIWDHLDKRGFQRREWGKNDHVLATVEKCNDIYTNSLQKSISINNQIIPRDETQTILDSLNNSETKYGVLLVGEAGIGKSGVMLQIVEKLKQRNFPILVFRVDTLKQPTPNPDQVGKDLGLPASPAIVIANIAQSHNRKG